ncbi:hypothetical protein H6G80_02665 [Nostoc sp. FACHB-87]|uniref:hypothetical protein n=1 Tax=Nostocaceae TaxID=1162 RepID=UPI00168A2FDD|nr:MULTISPECIES: hypothetical protein [Nostocaceae]MBD2452983.1 hypothetical protein [Nostoc sp. FACHB-87]MBD2474835.1 hypothetical protein [Anabaena sp. FACHB-83]
MSSILTSAFGTLQCNLTAKFSAHNRVYAGTLPFGNGFAEREAAIASTTPATANAGMV